MIAAVTPAIPAQPRQMTSAPSSATALAASSTIACTAPAGSASTSAVPSPQARTDAQCASRPASSQPVLDGRYRAGQRGHHGEPPPDEMRDVRGAFGDVQHGHRQHLLQRILAVLTEPGQNHCVVVEFARRRASWRRRPSPRPPTGSSPRPSRSPSRRSVVPRDDLGASAAAARCGRGDLGGHRLATCSGSSTRILMPAAPTRS